MTENLNTPEQLTITETELYNNIINKLDNVKNKITNLKNYSSNFENKRNIIFLEKFCCFSSELNNLKSLVDDMYNEFLLENDSSQLSNYDKNKRNNLIIEKKIQNTFLPYMLYLQILLGNLNNYSE